MIALNLHPAVGAPPDSARWQSPRHFRRHARRPSGSLRSTGRKRRKRQEQMKAEPARLAATLPSGLYVGKTSNTTSPVAGDPAPKEHVLCQSESDCRHAPAAPAARTSQPESNSKLSDEERAVFGDRKFYSLSLNMPNLNSAGGSWIIRFAALKPDSGSSQSICHAAAGTFRYRRCCLRRGHS